MKMNDIIDYNDKSLYEESEFMSLPDEKDFYTPEEAYELVMGDIHSIYSLKHAV